MSHEPKDHGILRHMSWLRTLPVVLGAAAAGPLGCYDLNDIRRGGQGESCGRTDDCLSPLVCVELTCVESGGATTTTTSAGGSGGTGGSPTTSSETGGAGGATSTTGMGGSGGNTTSTEGGGGAGGGTGGTGGTGLDPEVCAQCLDQACATEKAACDAGCVAIEACIEMMCSFLSSIGSDEEGECQVQCQQPFLLSKQEHLDVVFCAISAWPGCDACSSYPFDYEACVLKAIGGPCQATYEACNASDDCKTYRSCVGSCDPLSTCLACDDVTGGAAGRALLEEYHQCIAAECISEAWLP